GRMSGLAASSTGNRRTCASLAGCPLTRTRPLTGNTGLRPLLEQEAHSRAAAAKASAGPSRPGNRLVVFTIGFLPPGYQAGSPRSRRRTERRRRLSAAPRVGDGGAVVARPRGGARPGGRGPRGGRER